MRKLFLSILLCFIFSCSYAQTKEETISWVKEKLVKYLRAGYDCKSVSIESLDECFIVLRLNFRNDDADLRKIPTKDVYLGSFGKISSYNESIFSTRRKDYESYINERYVTFQYGEDNIRDRMTLALKKLSSFCPVKKEAF